MLTHTPRWSHAPGNRAVPSCWQATPLYRNLLDWEKHFNTHINKIRWKIEQTIAQLKTWRILHTDYRRPLNTFQQTISTVIALHFYQRA